MRENGLAWSHESEHVSQSSIASSNSRIAYIHTFMYAEPFFTASTRAASPSALKSFGPCLPLLNSMLVPARAADTHLSA